MRLGGPREAILMGECGGGEDSEQVMIDALEFGHQSIQPIIDLQERMAAEIGKPKREYPPFGLDEGLIGQVMERVRPSLEEILDRLVFRIRSVLEAKNSKYILMNVPNDKIDEVTRLLPVLKSPTVMPLAMKGWSSLHTVIKEDTFWEVIDKLKGAGAQGILVIPIEKMVI